MTIGAPVVFEGTTESMTADVPASAFDSVANACSAAGNADAFFTFTLTSPTPVRISTAGSELHNALSLWNYAPPSRTRPSSITPNPFTGGSYQAVTSASFDTRALAQTNTLGPIDGTWKVRAADTTGLGIEGLTTTSAPVGTNDEIEDLDAIVGSGLGDRYTRTTGASTTGLDGTSGTGSYSNVALQCGLSDDSAPDQMFSFTGTAGHTMRVGVHNPAPGFNAHVAVFEGTPGGDPSDDDPLTRSEATAPMTTTVSSPAANLPSAAEPTMPKSAPSPASRGSMAEKTSTPKAMAEGRATSMAASPPQTSPA